MSDDRLVTSTTDALWSLRLRQRESWQQDEQLTVEALVAAADSGPLADEALLELILSEFQLREEFGEQPSPEEYVRRFPQLRQRLERLFAVYAAIDNTESGQAANQTTDSDLPVREVALTQTSLIVPGQASPGFAANPIEERMLGSYRLLEKIGEGGMGVVYKARHQKLKKVVAIKLLPQHLTSDLGLTARFQREMESVGALDHPHIVRAMDAGEVEGTHFLVMEFVDGDDLAKVVKERGPLPVEEACAVIEQATAALQHAHDHGLVHRDIKPSNLMWTRDKKVKVLDLGLARCQLEAQLAADSELSESGLALGTLDYMSPEQARNSKGVDRRADIYSLGCTLYFLLTGQPLYARRGRVEKLFAHRDDAIPSLLTARGDIPAELERVYQRMVAKRPEDRYASMTEVLQALEALRFSKAAVHEALAKTNTDVPNSESHSATALLNANSDDGRFANDRTNIADPPLPPPPPQTRSRLWAVGFGGVAALLAAIIFTLKTPDGTIIVEINEPDARVEVLSDKNQIEVTRQSDTKPITISLDPGKHRLKVHKDGFELFTEEFSIEAAGKKTISAKLVANKAEPVPKLAISQRAAAKRLIEMGCVLRGFVSGVRNDGILQVPEQDFLIDGINGNESTTYRDEHAELFAQLPDLEVLDGGVLEMSAKGVQWLAKLPKLWKIGCSGACFDDEAAEQFVHLRNLSDFNLDTTKITQTGLAHLGKLVDLRELVLMGSNFDDEALRHLKPLRRLEVLRLGSTAVRGHGLRQLNETQSLKSIQLNWQKAGDDGLAGVSQFNQIVEIDVTDVASITDTGLAHLKNMPRLSRLLLSGTSISDRGLEHLKSLGTLEELRLHQTNVSDAGLLHLTELPRLRVLSLGDTRVTDAGLDALKALPLVELDLGAPGITDQGLSRLKDFRQLRCLALQSSTKLTGAGLAHLTDVSTLRELSLAGNGLAPQAWENISHLGQLEILHVSGSIVTNQALSQLSGLNALQVLYANDTSIGDDELVHIAGLKSLTTLELHRTQVTDQGLMQLRDMPRLRYVGCDAGRVTPAGVQALLNALPSLRGTMNSPDRRAAEWVIQLDGLATVRLADGSEATYTKANPLPGDEFHLLSIDLWGKSTTTDEGMENLSGLKHLRNFGNNGGGFGVGGMTVLGLIPSLQDMDLNSVAVTNEGLRQLEHLASLEVLNLVGAKLTDEGLISLKKLPRLRWVCLDDNSVSDAGIDHLTAIASLTGICLRQTKVTDAGVRKLASLPLLEALELRGVKLTDDSVRAVCGLKRLHTLELGKSGISERSIREIARLESLETLRLDENPLVEAALDSLPKSLTTLTLISTGLTDAGLSRLGRLENLRTLIIRTTNVTQAGVEKLHAVLPQCLIEWDGGVIEPAADPVIGPGDVQ